MFEIFLMRSWSDCIEDRDANQLGQLTVMFPARVCDRARLRFLFERYQRRRVEFQLLVLLFLPGLASIRF